MSQITADMNEWVMREMGASLRSLEDERKKEAKLPASPSRFKPKAPAKRYHERHPEVPAPGSAPTDVEGDTNMTDASEDEDGDDDDWVIEEYIRIPANSVALDVTAPSDVGFLVLDGEEESLLFFGPQNDDDDDWNEDEEDENGMLDMRCAAEISCMDQKLGKANCFFLHTSREPLHGGLPRGRGRL